MKGDHIPFKHEPTRSRTEARDVGGETPVVTSPGGGLGGSDDEVEGQRVIGAICGGKAAKRVSRLMGKSAKRKAQFSSS